MPLLLSVTFLLALTNTLAFYVTELITAVISFTIQAPGTLGLYLQRFIFFVTYEWAYKLVCYITVGWKSLTETNNLAF